MKIEFLLQFNGIVWFAISESRHPSAVVFPPTRNDLFKLHRLKAWHFRDWNSSSTQENMSGPKIPLPKVVNSRNVKENLFKIN